MSPSGGVGIGENCEPLGPVGSESESTGDLVAVGRSGIAWGYRPYCDAVLSERPTYTPVVIYSLRRERVLIVVGFALVAVAWLAYTTRIWSSSPPPDRGSNLTFGLASISGYFVLAAAGWAWFRWIDRSLVVLPDMTRMLRLFAIGNLLLSIGVAAVGYNVTHRLGHFPFDHSELADLSSYWLQVVGFLLVSAAYWSASSHVRRIQPGATNREPEPVSV